MQGLRLLLLSAIICVQVKYSSSVKEFFKDCADNNDCPDDSSCISIGTNRQCQCDNGYDAIDLPVTSGGEPVTVCKGKWRDYNQQSQGRHVTFFFKIRIKDGGKTQIPTSKIIFKKAKNKNKTKKQKAKQNKKRNKTTTFAYTSVYNYW